MWGMGGVVGVFLYPGRLVLSGLGSFGGGLWWFDDGLGCFCGGLGGLVEVWVVWVFQWTASCAISEGSDKPVHSEHSLPAHVKRKAESLTKATCSTTLKRSSKWPLFNFIFSDLAIMILK